MTHETTLDSFKESARDGDLVELVFKPDRRTAREFNGSEDFRLAGYVEFKPGNRDSFSLGTSDKRIGATYKLGEEILNLDNIVQVNYGEYKEFERVYEMRGFKILRKAENDDSVSTGPGNFLRVS